jgi:single-strand DNA-binding protein
MNTLRNHVQLLGNLGKDIELTTFDSGSAKASFPLATSDYYKNNAGEKVQETYWHNIVAWGKNAEFMNTSLSKGSRVLIKGKLVSRSYEDKQGNKKYITEVLANEFVNLDAKKQPF